MKWRKSLRNRIPVQPNAKPLITPTTPTTRLCDKNTRATWDGVAPSALSIPISRVFWTTNVMSALMIPKAATITMKNSR